MKTKSCSLVKPRICSKRGCEKKLRSNSQGNMCYEHRQQTVNKVAKKPIAKKKPLKPKGHIAGTYKGKFHNVLGSVDVLFLIINPAHRDCEMKFVFLKTVDVSPYKFFKALSNMKGMNNSAVSVAGLMTIKSKRPLHVADINHAMKKFIPDIKRFFPDVNSIDFKEPPLIYEVGEYGFKKSEKKIAI